jgi:hypothetical protein
MNKILSCSVLLAALATSVSYGADRCSMTFSACPTAFNNDTIDVPENVVAIAPNILACRDTIIKAVPSYLFIIDNSGSMSSTSDRNGSRFTVTKALLDTLFRMQPATEVGLVVFQEHLFFDITSTQFYAQYFKALPVVYDTQPNQAYLPFLTLNQYYNGLTGLQILDSILATNANNSALRYAPNWNQVGNTNINVAFEAAKNAFLSAKNPKSQQYIIFLSDGEPRGIWQAGQDSMYFTQGLGVPTTFTVFFTSGSAPQSLTTMTQNIKTNAYSTSNPMSNLWAIQTSHDALLNLLMTNVLSHISEPPGIPVQMTINNVISNIYSNGSFVFQDSFLLGTGLFKYTMFVTYRYSNPTTPAINDTVDTTTFYIRSSPTAGTTPGIYFNCIQNRVRNPISSSAGMPHLSVSHLKNRLITQIRYSLPANFIGKNISIELYNVKGGLVRIISDKATNTHSSFSWDERDAFNKPVRPGTYVLRLHAGTTNMESRFVIMR